MSTPLSKRQREALSYFRAIVRRGDVATCDAIARCMDISRVTAFEHLSRLVDKGFLVRHPHRGFTLAESSAMAAIRRYRLGLIDDPETVIDACETELMGAA
ncbi:MAG: hypothetical protein AAGI54_04045 [Planctomycetota bacterium]